jgi:hypothetical protein
MSKQFKLGSAVAVVAAAAAGTYGAAIASAHGTSTPGGPIGAILTFIIDLVLDILGIPGNALGSLFGGR